MLQGNWMTFHARRNGALPLPLHSQWVDLLQMQLSPGGTAAYSFFLYLCLS